MNVHAMRRVLAQDIERVETEALEAQAAMLAADEAADPVALSKARCDYECAMASLARKQGLFIRTAATL